MVLAAGGARRFGGAKLMAPLRGRPLATHVLDTVFRARATGVVADAVVVIAAGDAALADLLGGAGSWVRVVVNDARERGLSSSLRLGLAALGAEAGAAIVVLADQPLVRLETLAVLVAAWRQGLGVLVRPRYAEAPGEPGHPVLADRSVWPLAESLTGDAGFGAVLPAGSPGVAVIEVPGRNPDVDTPDDLTTLEGSWS